MRRETERADLSGTMFVWIRFGDAATSGTDPSEKGRAREAPLFARVIPTLMLCALCGRTPRRCAAGSRLIETRTGPTYSRGNEAVPFGVMQAVERYSAVHLTSSPVQEQDIQYVTGREQAKGSRSRPKNGRFPRDDREQERTVYTVAQPVTDA